MVKYHTLIKTIDHYIKCHPTIPERKQLLSRMSQDEKWEKLDKILNQGEKEWYNKLLQRREYLEKNIQRAWREDNTYGSYYHRLVTKDKPELENNIFKIERKYFEKPKEPKPIPEVDEGKYLLEKQYEEKHKNKIGDLEQKQIDLQNEQVKLTWDEIWDTQSYFGEGYRSINKKLNQGNNFMKDDNYDPEARKRTVRRVNKEIKNISSAINKTPGLISNMTVFHGGYFDVTQVVGDTVKFKGFTSASYQKNVADWMKHSYHSYDRELFYTYKILLPEGHKGLCANGNGMIGSLTSVNTEQEILLDKGLTGKILNIDYNNHEVTILADE